MEKAETAKQASEKIYKRAADALDAASSAKQNAETLIAKYQKEIPAQEENFAVKKAAYMDFMQEKQMTEEAWKQLAKENSRDDEKELTDTGHLIGGLRNLVGLEILPYHTMGINKYKNMGKEYPLEGVPEMKPEQAKKARMTILRAIQEVRRNL